MGNAVCVKGEKAQEAEVNAYVEENGLAKKKPSAAQEAKMVETIVAPNIQGQINGVKALAAPSSVEKQVGTAIELAEEALEEVEANPSKAFGGPSPFAAAGKELHAVGLTKCAGNS
jgi:NADP-dependent 3-hydroxy acid dehydrogenase YdfG